MLVRSLCAILGMILPDLQLNASTSNDFLDLARTSKISNPPLADHDGSLEARLPHKLYLQTPLPDIARTSLSAQSSCRSPASPDWDPDRSQRVPGIHRGDV